LSRTVPSKRGFSPWPNISSFAQKNGLWYAVCFSVLTIAFVAAKIAMPLVFDGSFIDEYLHIASGLEFFSTGGFAQIYRGEESYFRGPNMSIWVGLWVALFGKSIFVAKLAPLSLGIANYFLLSFIAQRTISDKKYILLLLAAYTLSPWVLFNHFYIRFYVFYELYALMTVAVSLIILDGVERNNWRVFLGGLGGILVMGGINLVSSNDQGSHMLTVWIALILTYVFVLESKKMWVDDKSRTMRGINALMHLHPLTKVAIIAGVFGVCWFFFNMEERFEFLLHGKLSFTSSADRKYDSFFLEKNLMFTIFFAMGAVGVFFFKSSHHRMFIGTSTIIFLIHFFSSEDLQITRGILYFIPFFLACACIPMSQVRYVSVWGTFGFFAGLTLWGTIASYPKDFLLTPRIPTEIHYIDYRKLYATVEKECSGATLVDASPSTFISSFYGVKTDHVLSAAGKAGKNNMYKCKGRNNCETIFASTPVITRLEELKISDKDTCLIVRAPSRWGYLPRGFVRKLESQKPTARLNNATLYRFDKHSLAALIGKKK
jgi:hypothetical protein